VELLWRTCAVSSCAMRYDELRRDSWASVTEGPKGCHQDARRSSRGLAEVALATPTMQAVQSY
jgi:hypothetical protein